VRAGLTTSQTTSDQQLTELLSCLEKKVATLVSKSSTLCDTLNTVTQEVSAALSSTQTEEDGIKE
jgi:chaperonin cofactor prefoldin